MAGELIVKNGAIISGSTTVSGVLTISGSIIPAVSKSFSLGSAAFPFRDIFISSGSLVISSDNPGAPSTTISNVSGNILISAGGMQLVGSGSFNAATGSFQYISGSLTQIGTVTRVGNTIQTGSLTITNGITGSLLGTSSWASNVLSSSFASTASYVVTAQTASYVLNAVSSSFALSSSRAVSSSFALTASSAPLYVLNSRTGSFATTGSNTFIGNQVITGSTNITGSLSLSAGSPLNINDGFFVNGNKQFNYGQFSSTQTQTGLANTAYAMSFNTIDFATGVALVNNTQITVINTGIYNIQFSTQLHTTQNNQNVDFSIWFARTGSDIANSNTDFSIEKTVGGGFLVAALNFLVQLNSNEYIELKYSKTTAQGQLQAKGAQGLPARPETPSAIVTVTQIA